MRLLSTPARRRSPSLPVRHDLANEWQFGAVVVSAARGSNPQRTVRDRELAKARQAAYRRLAALHVPEFKWLYADECRKAGIDTARPYWRAEK